MQFTASLHAELLGQQHYAALLDSGFQYCKRCGIRPNRREEEMSVWLSHVAIRYAISLGDDTWRFGFLNAHLTNRAWRDNLRHDRTKALGVATQFPYKESETYTRFTHVADGADRQVIAYTARSTTLEVVDMTLWRWRSPEKRIQCEDTAWCVPTVMLPIINGAEWEHYGVLSVNDETVQSYKCARSEAAEAIDELLHNKLNLTPQAPPPIPSED